MSVYENLKEHGIELPKQLAAAGLYKPVNQAGNLVFISGQGSMVDDTKITGRVGADLSVEEGAAAARICAINTLAALEAYLGDLNRVKRCVKIVDEKITSIGTNSEGKTIQRYDANME